MSSKRNSKRKQRFPVTALSVDLRGQGFTEVLAAGTYLSLALIGVVVLFNVAGSFSFGWRDGTMAAASGVGSVFLFVLGGASCVRANSLFLQADSMEESAGSKSGVSS